jgi:hypothetical protein
LSPDNLSAAIARIVGALVAATTNGTISTARLNEAVSHVLAVKHAQLCG